MDRTERFYRIDQLIGERKLVTFAELLDVLEVSPPPSSAISSTCATASTAR